MYRQLTKVLVDSPSTRGLEENGYTADDYQPAHVAFLAAAVIWMIIIICFVVLIVLQYIREREYINAEGRSKEVNWTVSLTRSILMDTESTIAASEADLSVRQSAVLDARYNLHTLFFALVQASFSMMILGGIQLNFYLTIKIVLWCVCGWTVLLGIFSTIWMSFVSETIGEGEGDCMSPRTDSLLHDLKNEMHRSPLSFVRHFIELSFFKPMINASEIQAGDIYQDIGRDGSRTFLLGVGQIILLTMYAWDVVDDGKPNLADERIYSFYCCGIVMQIAYLSGQDILYKSIYSHLSFWGNVLRAARRQNTYTWEPPRHLLYHRPRMVLASGSVRGFNSEASLRISNTPFLWLRFFFSTIVNIGGLNVITLLLPLQLASNDDPLAFVMAAVGAYYILGIDDYSEPVTYKLRNSVPIVRLGERMEMARRGQHRDQEGALGTLEWVAEEESSGYHRDLT